MLPLHEHSVWWVLLIVALALFMVHAMVETTLALMQKPPPRRRNPHSAQQVRASILALDDDEHPFTISERSPGWADIEWDPFAGLDLADPTRYRLTTRYRSRFLIDGERREVRLWESIRTTGFYYGFSGPSLRFGGAVSFYWGIVTGPWIGKAVEIVPGFPPRIG
ncbi:MAG: hypothetical protein ACRD1H_20405, partial [Vicinamibacterales bacterium]